MSELYLFLLALIPFILLSIFVIGLRWKTANSMIIVWLITVLIAYIIWKVPLSGVIISLSKAFFITIEILLIIIGAIWLLALLVKKDQMHIIQKFMSKISPDMRIQALIIAWVLGALIEGLAGFGTPQAISAPILVSLGFTPILAVTLAVIANSAPVSFGAAGTPILLGLRSLNLDSETISLLTKNVALIHSLSSIIVPLFIVVLVVINTRKSNKVKAIIETIPFILLSWLAFVIPYYLTARIIGPELPSILGGFIGLIITITAARLSILTPRSINRPEHKIKIGPTLRAFSPYLFIIFFLASSRTIPLIKEILKFVSLDIKSIGYSFQPFYSVSFCFLIAIILSAFIFKANYKESLLTLKESTLKVVYPGVTLIFTLGFVQLLLISGNYSELGSMPIIISMFLAKTFSSFYIAIAPFIGIFGAFIAGSNTVSNILFGSVQLEAAKAAGISIIAILSLQVVGGAIGNMIAIHNILAASATVGLHNQEGNIIRKAIIACIIYGILSFIIAALLIS